MNEIRLAGGVNVDINTLKMNPREGYMVAFPNHTTVVSTVDDETVRDFILKHTDDLSKKNTFFGCWSDGRDYVLDVSEWYERKRDAVFHAIVRKHDTVWDCAKQDEIKVNPRGSLTKQYINA